MTLYAAYGSNLDPRQMLLRAPHSPHRGTGWLRGWRLTFGGEEIGWEGAVATLAEDSSGSVFVSIYDLTTADENSLDEWEGVTTDLYRKIRVRVETLDGSSLCYVYVLNSFEGGVPSKRYLEIMTAAAREAGAPEDYILDLLNRAAQ
ncbi:MAG: gamma-glutamylcyclotransferase [Candidatus Nanopelagicaceae bacterium]|nr:gamma-glutamylcyclotransferase [Candidatus Nanopelagicaceae bacterium]